MKKLLAVIIALCMVINIELSARGGGRGGGGRGGRGGGRGGAGRGGHHGAGRGRGGVGHHGGGGRGHGGHGGHHGGHHGGRHGGPHSHGWRGGFGPGYAGFYGGGWGWGYWTATGFVFLTMAAALAAAGSTKYYDAQGGEATDESSAESTVINNYNYYGDSGDQAQDQDEEAMEMGTDEVE